jgi:tetratricopeptide (TPR) repeat protein
MTANGKRALRCCGVALMLSAWLAVGTAAVAQHERASSEPEKPNYAAVAQHEHAGGGTEKVGTVQFATSCSAEVQGEFNRAVAMLHSFWYQKSAETFAGVARRDPGCAMAEWGVAMSHYRQLWDPPTPGDLEAGWAAVQKAMAASERSPREQGYIAAMEVFYKDGEKIDHHTRAMAYVHAMEKLHADYPADREAAIFYALALRANASPSDKTYADQKRATAILEPIFAEQPDHPGLAHYIIHCDDNPTLAAQALYAARRYSQIAPDAPHALHMPSHIFTRLGLWQESIQSNLASAAAARKLGLAGDELHADDYLVYAYLQIGQDRDARKIVESMPTVRANDAAYYAGLYATASIPARMAIEEHRWKDAAALTLPANVFPGGRYRWNEADLHFARALGAARSGDVASAQKSLEQLTAIHDDLVRMGEQLSALLVEIQRKSVAAWILFVQGQKELGLAEMRGAADQEDATDRPPVAPGPIVPARELLGEMLLEAQQPALALEAFEADLRVGPERLNGLAGAGHAAERAGDLKKAAQYYSRVIANCPHADVENAAVSEARAFQSTTTRK